MQEHKEGVPSQFRPPYMLSGTVRCHRVGSPAGGRAGASTRAEASIPAELQRVGAALWVLGCRESLGPLPGAGEVVPSPSEVCCCWRAVSPVEVLQRKWTGCAMSEGIREWSTAATRIGKKTCIAKQMVLNVWPILNPPEKIIFLIRSTLVPHLLNSFWKEYDLQASRPLRNVRIVNLLIYINVNKLVLSTLFISSISF